MKRKNEKEKLMSKYLTRLRLVLDSYLKKMKTTGSTAEPVLKYF